MKHPLEFKADHSRWSNWMFLFATVAVFVLLPIVASAYDDTQCNFNNRQCKWDNVKKWQWYHPRYDGLKLDGPTSLMGRNIYALLVNFSSEHNGPVSLTSPLFTPTTYRNYLCFSFNYYMIVDELQTSGLSLNILTNGDKNSEEVWQTPAIYSDSWHTAFIELNQSKPFSFKFVASAVEGFVALENFRLSTSKCDRHVCDIESDTCGWTSTGDPSGYIFKRTVARYTSSKVLADHTASAPYGHVLYLANGNSGSKSRLQGPQMDAGLRIQCFSFWFMANGYYIDLKLFQHNDTSNSDMLIWKSNYTHLSSEWIRIQNTINFENSGYLFFEATKSNDIASSLEIDDISLNPYSCDPFVNCNFDNEICGWKDNINGNKFTWNVGMGRVENDDKLNFTSVPLPHRSVLYSDFTSLSPGSSGSMELLSEFFPAPPQGGACLNLYYIAKSIQLKTDSFQIDIIGITKKRTVLWKMNSTDAINEWNWQYIFVPQSWYYGSVVRFSMRAEASNSSTYIAVRRVYYQTTFTTCGKGISHATTTSTTTVAPTLGPSQSLNCDFESGTFCNWKPSSSYYNVATPRNTVSKYKPFMDHTKKSADGHFAYSYATNAQHKKGNLQAKNPFGKYQTVCFSFYYYFYAGKPSQLSVTLDNQTGSLTIFRAYGANAIKWNSAKFEVDINDTYNTISFVSDLRDGIVAIDDIDISLGSCFANKKKQTFCDFELGQPCMFEPVYSGTSADWTVYKAHDISYLMIDHTTHSQDGHFYGINIKQNNSVNSAKRYYIKSKELDQYTMYCFRFSYYLSSVGPNTTLSYGTTTSDQYLMNHKWKVAGSTNGMWFTHQRNIASLMTFYLLFDINVPSGGGEIFIDDVSLSTDYCSTPGQCDFENGDVCNLESVVVGQHQLSPSRKEFLQNYANYTQMTDIYLTDYVDVTWHVFTPRQSFDYVQTDYTYKNSLGKYLLLTANDNYDRGIIVTERYEMVGRDSLCLSLAVYKPSSASTLEIYQGESIDNGMGLKIWETRIPTSKWVVYEVYAETQNNKSIDIYFYIVGTLSDSSTYIAIDDIVIKETCTNPSNKFHTSTTTTGPSVVTKDPKQFFMCTSGIYIPIANVCDWVSDCPNDEDEKNCGSCSFANHRWCNYTTEHDSYSKFKFQFSDQTDVGVYYGPHYDHNYIIASGMSIFRTEASLTSPVIHQSYLACTLSFYYIYNMTMATNNDNYRAFYMYLRFPDLNEKVIIWQSTSEPLEKYHWKQIQLQLRRVKRPFQIEYLAYSSYNKYQYYGIADIRMNYCDPPSPSSSCSTGYFTCKNTVCVDSRYVCDFEDDCGDQSDEKNCDSSLMTSFEEGLNRWGEGVMSAWRIAKAKQFDDLRKGPTYDHTSDFTGGSFLFVDSDAEFGNNNLTAEIDSPPIVPKGDYCTVRMQVFKNSCNSTLLVILENLKTGQRRVLEEYKIASSQYVRLSNGIPKDESGYYKIVLLATLNTTRDSFVNPYIAIDDINFSSDCAIANNVPTLAPNVTTEKPNGCDTIWCLGKNDKYVCLETNQICDFVQNCKDGSDEKYCGNCNFDDGQMCEWTNYENQFQMWKVMYPANKAIGNLPRKDGNLNYTGGYLVVTASNYGSNFVILKSPVINQKTAETCKIQFDYMSVSGADFIVRVNNDKFLYQNMERVPYWQTFKIDVGEQQAGFSLFFKGYGSNTINHQYLDMALDNFKMLDCAPGSVNPNKTKPTNISVLNCAFEDDMCGWLVTGSSERSNWFRTRSTTIEPGIDHTTFIRPVPTKFGTWVSTQAKMDDEFQTNYLQSALPLQRNSQTYCISFWYYYFGAKLSYFSLVATPNATISSIFTATNMLKPLWMRSIPKVRNWDQAFVEIPPQQSDFYLTFVAKISSLTVVGIDDVQMYNTSCPIVSSEFCDFEVNNCDWTNPDGRWVRSEGSTSYVDHTTDTTNGHFLQDNGTGQQAKLHKQLKTLPYFANLSDFDSGFERKMICLNLYYLFDTDNVDNKFADNSSQLSFGTYQNDHHYAYKNISMVDIFNYKEMKTWSLLRWNFFATKSTTLSIEGTLNTGSTRILLDDISILPHRCEDDGNCDFENDMCGWINDHNIQQHSHYVLWMRIQPNSRFIRNTILYYDHTTSGKNGNYLVMPLEMQKDSYSSLRSPPINRQQRNICFTMYYFAQGTSRTVKALKVSFQDLTRGHGFSRHTEVLNTTTGLYWNKYQKEFLDVPRMFAFQIESQYNASITSDIGIDDISIQQGLCPGNHQSTTTTALPNTEKTLDCSFEHPNCEWKFDKTVWNVTSYQSQKNIFSPKADHTYGYSLGHYLLFTGSRQQSYLLESETTLPYTNDHCLTLWYYDDGEDPFLLMFFMSLNGQYSEISMRSSTLETRVWKIVKVDVPYYPELNISRFGLRIIYTPTSLKYFSILALDDIAVRPGKCSHKDDYVYTFTDGLEDLELENVQPIQSDVYKIYNCQFDHVSGAPTIDHTTNSNNGSYFLFMNRMTAFPTTYIITLSVMDLPEDNSQSCVRFAYQSSGNVKLRVYSEPDSDTSNNQFMPLGWVMQYNKQHWTIVEFNKQITYKHKMVFYMEKPMDTTSFIALDDITVLGHQCETAVDCDFENNQYCSYSPYSDKTTTNHYNFAVFDTPSPDPNWPGPKYDHTTKSFGGGYLFMTGYRSMESFAQLVSKVISGSRNLYSSSSYCLSMWSMLTSTNAELLVHVVRYGEGWTANNQIVQVLHLSNIVQADWTRISATLDPNLLNNATEIQIIIEGRISADKHAFIAIDDISITAGKCSYNGLVCPDKQEIAPSKVCDFVKDCKSGYDELNCGDCTFENGQCSWTDTNVLKNQKWILQQASTNKNENAPNYDGSMRHYGHYITMTRSESSMTSRSEMAINYQSPQLYQKQSYKTCVMQFQYYIKTANQYYIKVRTGTELNDLNAVYTIFIDSQNEWREGEAHIGEHYSNFFTDIEAYQKDSRGVIAIDNIKFINCSIPKPMKPGQGCLYAGQVLCNSTRFCINQDDVCDLINDCGDETDEMNCFHYPSACTFESLYGCKITTEDDEAKPGALRPNIAWSTTNGAYYMAQSVEPGYEPAIDNTKRTRYGKYFILQPTKSPGPHRYTMKSSFYTPMFTTSNGPSCRIRFFYFTNGKSSNINYLRLEIFVRYANKPTEEAKPIWTATGNLQQRWTKSVAEFSSTEPFQFVFRGGLSDISSRIGIDDISYSPECIPSTANQITTTTPTTTTNNGPGPTHPDNEHTTQKPIKTNSHSSHVGGVLAGIFIPTLLILGAIGGYYGYRHYQRTKGTNQNIALSMRSIQSRFE